LLDWFFRSGSRKRMIDWLGLDARIDSGLASAWENAKDRYDAFSSFFARFRLTGWRRGLAELVSEGLTLAVGGLAVLYVVAIPALTEFDEKRITTGRYAVTFVDRNGTEIGRRGILHNDAVSLEEIPDHLIKATLATEDRRFFEHFGIDVLGTMRALVENARANDVVQGGSSITQQLAKNLFLSNERSLVRKIKEAFLALLLEARFTKPQILKMYLDRAYLGGGAFGVEAASQFYFGKSVRDINLAESAVLAGLFKAPTKFAPHINLPASRARTNDVLNNLVEAGYMSAGQVHAARLNPARVMEPQQSQSPDWFLDWAFEEVQRIAEGKGSYVLTARVTVDLDMQRAAQEALVTTLRSTGARGNPFSGAMVAMDPDGAVRAVVGGIDYGESQFNRATNARRQPGSSFKLYVYATALENGYTPRSLVRDASGSCGNWAPRNYSGSGGSGRSLTLTDAFKVSLNTTAADLSFKVVLYGAGRHRHHGAAAHRRLRHVRQRRQAHPALCRAGAYQLQGRGDLLARARRAGGAAGDRPPRGRDDEPDDAGGGDRGDRPEGHTRLHARGRQDRHQLRLARRVVRGLHRCAGGGRVGGPRRLPPHVAGWRRRHGRHLANPGVARLHVGGAHQPEHPHHRRADAASRPGGGAAAPGRA
jgi:penicillin-binding protein 1A